MICTRMVEHRSDICIGIFNSHFVQHFNNGGCKEFSVQILEKLKCSGKKLTKKELGLEKRKSVRLNGC